MRGRRGALYRLSLTVCAAGLAVSAGLFARQWMEYRAGAEAYQVLAETAVSLPDRESPPPERSGADRPEPVAEETPPLPQVDFAALEGVSPDVVGWLHLPDTRLSYPVVQGEDNSYYLDHLFDGTPNASGCLFLDSGCPGLEGRNSVIYGHHMKNGTMFGELDRYQDQDYYQAHPVLWLLTPEGAVTVEIFSAYVTGAEWDAWQLTFSTQEEYSAWLEGARERSVIDTGVIPADGDRVITLSTCNYTFPGARFVCHGLVRGD